jgi:hypothetical protein
LDLGNEFLDFTLQSLAVTLESWLVVVALLGSKLASLFSGGLLDVELELPLGNNGSSGGDGLHSLGSLLGKLQFLEFVGFLNGLDGADLGSRDISGGFLVLNGSSRGLLFTSAFLLLLDLDDLLDVLFGSLELGIGLLLKS